MKVNLKQTILASVLLIGGAIPAINMIEAKKADNVEIASVARSAATKSDDVLQLAYTWSPGGVQDYALNGIVDAWNNMDEESRPTEWMPIELVYVSGGYSALSDSIQQMVKAGNTEELPDIYINYADVTSILLNAKNQKGIGESLALDLGAYNDDIVNDINESFLASNELIAGAEEGETYLAPVSISSELMGIDIPLMEWFAEQWTKAGGELEFVVGDDDSTTAKIADAADGTKDGSPETAVISDEDRGTIESYWKIKDGADVTGQTLTVNDATFESAEKMLEFSINILKVVEPVDGTIQESDDHGIFAYDSLANNFYVYAQAATNALNNPENALIQKNGDEVTFNLLEKNSNAWNQAEEILNWFATAFNNGVQTGGDGWYGSDDFKNHRIAMSIGSTAGTSYYYDTKKPGLVNFDDLIYVAAPGKFKADDEVTVHMQQGPSMGGIKSDDDNRNKAIANFIEFVMGPQKEVFDTGIKTDYAKPSNFDDMKGKVVDATGTPLASATNPFGDDLSVTMDSSLKHAANNDADQTDGIQEANYEFAPDGMYSDSYGDEWGYWNIDGSSDYVMADGYYGVELFNFKDGAPGSAVAITVTSGTEEITPAQYLASESGYFVGSNNMDETYTSKLNYETTQYSSAAYADMGKLGPAIAYQNIQEADANEDVQMESEPYSIYTSSFRDLVSTDIAAMRTDIRLGHDAKTGADILGQWRTTAIKNGWPVGDVNTEWKWWMTLLIVLAVVTVVGAIGVGVYFIANKKKSNKI